MSLRRSKEFARGKGSKRSIDEDYRYLWTACHDVEGALRIAHIAYLMIQWLLNCDER
jgi:hypothetical protein